MNTGAPQGCVLSHILFSVYTNEVVSTSALLTLVKFADDMALVARLWDEKSHRIFSSFTLLNLTHVLVEEATEFWSQQL